MIWSSCQIALREILRNRMRSLLTMLGIIIGVAAVITMVMLGDGATASVTADVSALGQNMLLLSPGFDRHGPGATISEAAPLEEEDAHAIRRDVPGLTAVAPAGVRQMLVGFGGTTSRPNVIGTTSDYLEVREYEIALGRTIDSAEETGGRPVCLLGQTARHELFGSGNPLAESVRVGTLSCNVVGVLREKPTSNLQDPNDVVLLPLHTFQRRIAGNRDVSLIYMSVESGRSHVLVKHQIELLMRERRQLQPQDENDFHIRDMQELISTLSSVTGVLTTLLGSIAAVSLLVGGIGIMNIMLVSVTERTREIGIRLAIGARRREVLLQFLIEALAMALLGGVVGVVTGIGAGHLATSSLGMPSVVSPRVVGMAFAFSGCVGVLFGFLPARKAARLNPIEALHHE